MDVDNSPANTTTTTTTTTNKAMTRTNRLENMKNLLGSVKPFKTLQCKPFGIMLQGVVLEYGLAKTKDSAAGGGGVEIAHDSDIKGTTSGGKGSRPKMPRYRVTFLPTNVDRLVTEWLEAGSEKRSDLPYVPVMNAKVPTIRMRFTSAMKYIDEVYYSFILPADRPEFLIQQYVAKTVSCFGHLSLEPLDKLVNIVSYCLVPQKARNTSGTSNNLETIIRGQQFETVLYSSCTTIIPLENATLDSIPREYKADALAFHPSFEPLSLEAVAAQVDGTDTDLYRPLVHRFKIVDEEIQETYERVNAETGEICTSEESGAGMHYTAHFYKTAKEGGEVSERDPSAFVFSKDGVINPFMNPQIDFGQWHEKDPYGNKGIVRCGIFEEAIAHCGINNHWALTMSANPIPSTVVLKINSKKTMELGENKNPSLRVDTAPLGIFQGYLLHIVWHMIEFLRSGKCIPVTAEWVKAALKDEEKQLMYKSPTKHVNVVNNCKGMTYGFKNMSEYTDEDKKKILDPQSGWKFACIVALRHSEFSDEEKALLAALTPEEGVKVMDGQPLTEKGNFRLQKNKKTPVVVMAYKFDESWLAYVDGIKEERIQCLSNWLSSVANNPDFQKLVQIHDERQKKLTKNGFLSILQDSAFANVEVTDSDVGSSDDDEASNGGGGGKRRQSSSSSSLSPVPTKKQKN